MIFRGVAEKLLIEMELCFDNYVVRGVLSHLIAFVLFRSVQVA